MRRTGKFSQAPDFGFCASQNTYYFGYKLHALCGLSGVIHSYDLSKSSVADLQYMKDVKHTYHECSIYGDNGYIGVMHSLTCSKPHAKTGVSVSAQPKGQEAEIHSVCEGKKED